MPRGVRRPPPLRRGSSAISERFGDNTARSRRARPRRAPPSKAATAAATAGLTTGKAWRATTPPTGRSGAHAPHARRASDASVCERRSQAKIGAPTTPADAVAAKVLTLFESPTHPAFADASPAILAALRQRGTRHAGPPGRKPASLLP